MTYDDEEIERAVKEFQAGVNRQANFVILYNVTQSVMATIFTNKRVREEDRDDLTQNVILRVHRKVDEFRCECPFGAWVYRIAYHAWVDLVRGQAREAQTLVPIGNDNDEDFGTTREPRSNDAAADPFAVADSKERQRLVVEAITLLPKQMGRCATLYYLEGFNCEEIARILGRAEGTVKHHLFQALQKIRAHVEKRHGNK